MAIAAAATVLAINIITTHVILMVGCYVERLNVED